MSVKIMVAIYVLVYIFTAILTLNIGNLPGHLVSVFVEPFHNVIFAWHLACWMVLGVIANYIWDLFGANNDFSGVSLPALLMPVLVPPIVFLLYGR